ncbi:MAG: sugar phosphate isomerase/epimerase [Armatimonadetes bacterium]|nr:sugar phosphate isomerase/epimerase [Armatimonadota bacterium]
MELDRFSTCTYPLRDEPFDHAFARLAATGLTRLDVWGRQPHFSADPAECDPAEFEAAAAAAGVSIANLGSYVGHNFDSGDSEVVEAEMAKTRATIDLARRFGCRSIRAMPGHGEDAAVINKIAPHLREAAAYAETQGVYLGIENHAGSIAGHPELALRLCEAVGSRYFGVLYEPCNLLHGGVDYRAAFGIFKDWITHVHLKDGRLVNGKFERCHLGQGEVDVPWCLDQLGGIGYDGDFALEYEIRDLEEIDTGLVKWRQYIESL